MGDEASGSGEKTGVVLAALSANAVIAVAKFVAASVTGSSAMLSEGIHSLADTSNQALLLLGAHRSKRAPDAAHPFGYGQELYFWGLIVALVLFGLGGGLSIYEGIHQLMSHSSELGDPMWNYIVLGVAFLAEGISWTIAVRAFQRTRPEGRGLLRALNASKDPRVFVPVGEDTAALAGILVAFLGVLLSHQLQAPWIDSAASIVIGLILAAVAFYLARETKNLLIGEGADPRLADRIRAAAEGCDPIRHIGAVLTMQLGPDEVLLNLEVAVDPTLTVEQTARALQDLEAAIREEAPEVTRIFSSLDIDRGTVSGGYARRGRRRSLGSGLRRA
ncbi:MAG: cation diffusion facilitator family transporter [Deltaproteobacteria bacterium]|nr:cation diffusion facilitator family transporter [Deltaproteobacteria bacterium]